MTKKKTQETETGRALSGNLPKDFVKLFRAVEVYENLTASAGWKQYTEALFDSVYEIEEQIKKKSAFSEDERKAHIKAVKALDTWENRLAAITAPITTVVNDLNEQVNSMPLILADFGFSVNWNEDAMKVEISELPKHEKKPAEKRTKFPDPVSKTVKKPATDPTEETIQGDIKPE